MMRSRSMPDCSRVFPTLDMEIVDIVAEGDEVVVRGRLRGTHDGPFLGVPATGNAVDVPDVTMFTLADGPRDGDALLHGPASCHVRDRGDPERVAAVVGRSVPG